MRRPDRETAAWTAVRPCQAQARRHGAGRGGGSWSRPDAPGILRRAGAGQRGRGTGRSRDAARRAGTGRAESRSADLPDVTHARLTNPRSRRSLASGRPSPLGPAASRLPEPPAFGGRGFSSRLAIAHSRRVKAAGGSDRCHGFRRNPAAPRGQGPRGTVSIPDRRTVSITAARPGLLSRRSRPRRWRRSRHGTAPQSWSSAACRRCLPAG